MRVIKITPIECQVYAHWYTTHTDPIQCSVQVSMSQVVDCRNTGTTKLKLPRSLGRPWIRREYYV